MLDPDLIGFRLVVEIRVLLVGRAALVDHLDIVQVVVVDVHRRGVLARRFVSA